MAAFLAYRAPAVRAIRQAFLADQLLAFGAVAGSASVLAAAVLANAVPAGTARAGTVLAYRFVMTFTRVCVAFVHLTPTRPALFCHCVTCLNCVKGGKILLLENRPEFFALYTIFIS